MGLPRLLPSIFFSFAVLTVQLIIFALSFKKFWQKTAELQTPIKLLTLLVIALYALHTASGIAWFIPADFVDCDAEYPAVFYSARFNAQFYCSARWSTLGTYSLHLFFFCTYFFDT